MGMVIEHTVECEEKMLKELQDDIRFLLTLVPDWAKNTQPGLSPTMYGTGSFITDKEIVERVKKIKQNLKKKLSDFP